MSYATDGKCHNANRGTYGHECGKPAVWVGEDRNGFRSGFCSDCRNSGDERHNVLSWQRFNLGHEVALQINRKHVDDRGIVDEVAMRQIFDHHNLAPDTRVAIWRALTNRG